MISDRKDRTQTQQFEQTDAQRSKENTFDASELENTDYDAIWHKNQAPGNLAFGAREHRDMGNLGSNKAGGDRVKPGMDRENLGKDQQWVQLDVDYKLQFGEVVALAGDHFSSIEQMRVFARNKNGGSHSRLEIEYARKWQLEKDVEWHEKDPKYIEAKAAQEKRYFVLAGGNEGKYKGNANHFTNPKAGDTSKPTAAKALDADVQYEEFVKNQGTRPREVGSNATAAYRMNHVSALIDAAMAGKQGASIDEAMATDAFACHYLSDSFAAGHIRTPRIAAKEYWDAKVPMFSYNLVGYMAESIARFMRANKEDFEQAKNLDADKLPENVLWKGARDTVRGIFKQSANLTFGDVIALAIHDWDNKKGVKAHVNGKQETLKGDGSAEAYSPTETLVNAAIEASVNEVRMAHKLGVAKEPKDVVTFLFDFEDKLFRAERHIPTTTPEDLADASNPELKWKFSTFEQVLSDSRMQEAIKVFLGDKAAEVEKVKRTLSAGEGRAVDELTGKMRGDPRPILSSVIHWTPDTGGWDIWTGTGSDTDDQAREYVKEARKTKGGLASLTAHQRVKLIIDVMNGVVTESDEETAWQVLDAASHEQAKQVIDAIKWDDLAKFFDGAEGGKFRKRFPKAQWGEK
ncbi:MAG: hypothetical protein WKG01_05505 [Kofleriaceae bacterium]